MAKEVVRPPPKGKKKKKKGFWAFRGGWTTPTAGRPGGLGQKWGGLANPFWPRSGATHDFFFLIIFSFFFLKKIIIIILMVKTTSFWSPKWCNFGVRDKTDFLAGSVRISQMKS
jgi:hypothetical protein